MEKDVRQRSKELSAHVTSFYSVWYKKNECAGCGILFSPKSRCYIVACGEISEMNVHSEILISLINGDNYLLHFCKDCFEDIAGEYYL